MRGAVIEIVMLRARGFTETIRLHLEEGDDHLTVRPGRVNGIRVRLVGVEPVRHKSSRRTAVPDVTQGDPK